MHFAHRVELVVLTREERLQLECPEPRAHGVDGLDQLRVERGIVLTLGGRLLGQLEQGVGVVERGAEGVELVEIGRDPPQLPSDGARVVGVVP